MDSVKFVGCPETRT